jgi:hypothetical protein
MIGESTTEDAQRITILHLAYYKHDTTFMTNLKHDPKTMWLYAKNMDKDKTNMDMLIQTSKENKMPVSRFDCHFETKWISRSSQQECTACINHFDGPKGHPNNLPQPAWRLELFLLSVLS